MPPVSIARFITTGLVKGEFDGENMSSTWRVAKEITS